MKTGDAVSVLLRLEAITPVHIGGGSGDGQLQRQLRKDPQFGLPFLPDSSLKGVLAGRHGNVPDEGGNLNRERIYGSPDRGFDGDRIRQGRPSEVVFGHGELFRFPFLDRRSRRFYVYPAGGIARALSDVTGADGYPETLQVLGLIQGGASSSPCLSFGAWPDSEPFHEAEALIGTTARRHAGKLLEVLDLFGGLRRGERVLIVPQEFALLVWRVAAERRASTAIDPSRGAARENTLRTLELIPTGTVFMSLVTLEGEHQCGEIKGQIQIGAGKNQGLGWLNMVPLNLDRLAQPPDALELVQRAGPTIDDADIFVRMHQAINDLKPAGLQLKKRLWSSITAFGPRAAYSGIEASMAFELAKAKPARAKCTQETWAHRWLLRTLVGLPPPDFGTEAVDQLVLDWLTAGPFSDSRLRDQESEIMARWSWLRRFGELNLCDWESTP